MNLLEMELLNALICLAIICFTEISILRKKNKELQVALDHFKLEDELL